MKFGIEKMMPASECIPKQVVSGAIHYFRVHDGLWDDRLNKAAAFGLNAVETYVPWNCHEPHRGEYDFSGRFNLELFLRKTAEHGLRAILRPGPYICAEWDNGGFPGWLNAVPGIKLRCMNEPYLKAVENWFAVLLPRIKPFLASCGGPVIMMQVENEYGSYGNDTQYMEFLVGLYRKHGVDVPLFTSDGPYGIFPLGGTVDGVLATANFGTRSDEAFKAMRRLRPEGPDFCMEFWNGWFDHWGEKHQSRPAADGGDSVPEEFDRMLSRGASVNFYMFHGGTNFGLTAGANGNAKHDYAPVVTSYDYDCLLSECGDPTPKFYDCRRVLRKHTGRGGTEKIPETKKITLSPVMLAEYAALSENIGVLASKKGKAVVPPTMEELGENFGMIRYRTHLRGPEEHGLVQLLDVNDYVQVRLNGELLGMRFRENGQNPFEITIPESGAELELLVENTGRINYGPFLGLDGKGIVGGVCIGFQRQFGWTYEMLPMSSVENVVYCDVPEKLVYPCFRRGFFDLTETGEAFLKFPGVKGMVWINGFSLGRYWQKGPSSTLYIPSPVLKKGRNEIVVFEFEKLFFDVAEFSPVHKLG